MRALCNAQVISRSLLVHWPLDKSLYARSVRSHNTLPQKEYSVRTCPLESLRLCVGCISAEPTIASPIYDRLYAQHQRYFLMIFLYYCNVFHSTRRKLLVLYSHLRPNCFIVLIERLSDQTYDKLPILHLIFHTIVFNRLLSVPSSAL